MRLRQVSVENNNNNKRLWSKQADATSLEQNNAGCVDGGRGRGGGVILAKLYLLQL